MEVHTHPHVHKKKDWKSYFWEFLMLFLAVTLGFFVENQREHVVEHQRAKQFAKELIEDLQKDTVEILDVIHDDQIILACFDSASSIVHRGITGYKVPGSFYYYSSIATSSPSVSWNDATLIQMTQSGSLRYFTNPELVRKISYYFSETNYVKMLNANDKSVRDKSMEIRSRILNNYEYSRFSTFSTDNWLHMPDSLMNKLFFIQTNDANMLNEFANSFENRRRVLDLVLKRVYPAAIENARELTNLLKEEYHLE
jgi:hypothetical protein